MATSKPSFLSHKDSIAPYIIPAWWVHGTCESPHWATAFSPSGFLHHWQVPQHKVYYWKYSAKTYWYEGEILRLPACELFCRTAAQWRQDVWVWTSFCIQGNLPMDFRGTFVRVKFQVSSVVKDIILVFSSSGFIRNQYIYNFHIK